jgi:AcrR family transcriptional regulator
VLAAARELFISEGYEAATIRQIANLAGVSVGSVFTTFTSKGEILSQVMEDRLEALTAELDQLAAQAGGSTVERLKAMFAVHFRFEFGHVQLFLAHIAAAYDWTLSPEARPYGRNPRFGALIEDCLADGAARGDVDPGADRKAVVDLLRAAYAWTYRLVASGEADAEAMIAVMDRRIELIAQGFRPL